MTTQLTGTLCCLTLLFALAQGCGSDSADTATPDGHQSVPTDVESADDGATGNQTTDTMDAGTAPMDSTSTPPADALAPVEDTTAADDDAPTALADTSDDAPAPAEDTAVPLEDAPAPVEDAGVSLEDADAEEADTPTPSEDTTGPVADTVASDTDDAEEDASPLPNSCEGACGGTSADGSCDCNSSCIGKGTCCADAEDFCSELPCGCPASHVCLTGSMMPGAPPTTSCKPVCSFANGGCGPLPCEGTALGALCLCPDNATWNDVKCISFQGEKCDTPGDDNCNGIANENCPGQKSSSVPIPGCVCTPPFVADGEGGCACPVGSVEEADGCVCTPPFVSTEAGECACPEGLFQEGESCVDTPTPDPLMCDLKGGEGPGVEGTLACPEGSPLTWDFYALDVSIGDCVHIAADNAPAGAESPAEPLSTGADLVAALIGAEDVHYGLAPGYAQLDDEHTCSVPPWFEGAGCPDASVTATASGEILVAIAQWGGEGCTPDAPYTLHVAINGVTVDLSAGPAYQGPLTVLPQFQTLPIVLENLGTHEMLLDTMDEADVDLSDEGPYTLFAPTDAAFEAFFLAAGISDNGWLNSEGLEAALLYHVAEGLSGSDSLSDGQEIPTLSGQPLTLSVVDGLISINGAAMVITPDVQASNGVIHVIDAVLTAPEG